MVDFFEGAEKTLMVEFPKLRASLRDHSDEQWSAILQHASCSILSKISCGDCAKKKSRRGCTAFVLSESSLFVYDRRIVLKTCGQTSPIHVLPSLFELAETKSVRAVVYSHPTLVQPGDQPKGYASFEDEAKLLEKHFEGGGKKYYLGDADQGVQVYVLNNLPKGAVSDWMQAEVFVRDLDESAMTKFSKGGEVMASWWEGAQPDSLDEFYFEPYGYSANALTNHFYTTTHATPQASCSYFSCATNAPFTAEELRAFVSRACTVAEGKQVSVFLLCMSPMLALKGPEVSGYDLTSSSTSFVPDKVTMSLQTFEPSPVAPIVPSIVSDSSDRCPRAVLRSFLNNEGPEFDAPVMLIDTSAVQQKVDAWKAALPQVQPFYAVKCNQAIAQPFARAQNGVCFDVASAAEIKLALEVGASPENLVYSNPCKQVSQLVFAREQGVKLIVVDNEAELDKVAAVFPEAELLVRVQTDDVDAQCPMSNKFGCPVERCPALLDAALKRGLEVVGVSFHVGSGCSTDGAFTNALGRARRVFGAGIDLGFPMNVVDIGGGFPGGMVDALFSRMAAEITNGLRLFPDTIRAIAEPGRYFAHAAGTLCAQVIAEAPVPGESGVRYYLNDGVYGCFNCLVYDHASVSEGPFTLDEPRKKEVEAHFFGPTCDGFDALFSKHMPKLQSGDWLIFPSFGAYTNAASSSFNGMKAAVVHTF